MKKQTVLFMLVVVSGLAACSFNASDSGELAAQSVIDEFNEVGLGVEDVEVIERSSDSPLPNSYKENLGFSISEISPEGGQVFVCDMEW